MVILLICLIFHATYSDRDLGFLINPRDLESHLNESVCDAMNHLHSQSQGDFCIGDESISTRETRYLGPSAALRDRPCPQGAQDRSSPRFFGESLFERH